MIPLGCLPSQKSRSSLDDIINGRQCVQELNDFAKDFNSKLEQALTMMQARFTDSIIKLAAIYDTFEDMVKSPAQYGNKCKCICVVCRCLTMCVKQLVEIGLAH